MQTSLFIVLVETNLLLVLLLVNGGLGNPVKIPLAGLGDAASALLLVVLKDTDLLERLDDLAVDGTGGIDVVVGAGATVLGRAVDLAQAANTDGLAHVDVTGNGSGADVVPAIITVRWGRSIEMNRDQSYQSASWGGSSLELEVLTVSTHPNNHQFQTPYKILVAEAERTRDGELALTLQESRVGSDELLRL